MVHQRRMRARSSGPRTTRLCGGVHVHADMECVCAFCVHFSAWRASGQQQACVGRNEFISRFSSSYAFKSTAAEPDARRAECHTPTPTHTHTHTQRLDTRTHATHVQLTRGTAALRRTLHLQRAHTPPWYHDTATRCCGVPRNNGRDVRSREVSDPTRPLQALPSVVLAGACSQC
jgi:hypothetical protein